MQEHYQHSKESKEFHRIVDVGPLSAEKIAVEDQNALSATSKNQINVSKDENEEAQEQLMEKKLEVRESKEGHAMQNADNYQDQDKLADDTLSKRELAHRCLAESQEKFARSLKDIQNQMYRKKIFRVDSNRERMKQEGCSRSRKLQIQRKQIMQKQILRKSMDVKKEPPRSLTRAAILASRQHQMNMQYA